MEETVDGFQDRCDEEKVLMVLDEACKTERQAEL